MALIARQHPGLDGPRHGERPQDVLWDCCDDFLTKPIDQSLLLQMVAEWAVAATKKDAF